MDLVSKADFNLNYINICQNYLESEIKRILSSSDGWWCSEPSPVEITVARDDGLVVFAGEQSVNDLHVVIILSTDLVPVNAINVYIFAAVWNLVPEMQLAVNWAEHILIAKDALDGDLAAHVLHVEVLRVLDDGPQARVLLPLVVEVVLAHVLNVLDTSLARTPKVVWNAGNVGGLQTEALGALCALHLANKVNLLLPVLAED